MRGPWRVVECGGVWGVQELDDGEWMDYCATDSVEHAQEIARTMNEAVWGEAYPEEAE